MDLAKCHCGHIFDYDDAETHIEHGSVGHIDDWEPDEYTVYCPECGGHEDHEYYLLEDLHADFKKLNDEVERLKLERKFLWYIGLMDGFHGGKNYEIEDFEKYSDTIFEEIEELKSQKGGE